MKPFQATMDLETETALSIFYESYYSALARKNTKGKLATERLCDSIDKILKENDLDRSKLLVRGGFREKKNIDLIFETGWDYEQTLAEHTYMLPVTLLEETHLESSNFNSPLFKVVQNMNNAPALAFYDASMLTFVERPDDYAYKFDGNKLDAFRGILRFNQIGYCNVDFGLLQSHSNL